MGRHLVETVLGAVVLLVAGMFVYFAYGTAQIKDQGGYQLKAAFFKIGGLTKGSDVRINGIKVGTVTSAILNPESYDAELQMTIHKDIKLPVDSTASIGSLGILGGKYLRLEPGSKKEFIEPDGSLTNTRDFRSLEDQVGEIIFLATGGKDN